MSIWKNFAKISGTMESDIDASEDGSLKFFTSVAGTHDVLFMSMNDASSGNISLLQNIEIADATDIILNATTGTKIGTATTEKLGLWNVTPVIQPAGTGETVGFVAGAGTSVLDDSTFTGNIGATAYRISDIVKALKQLGVLAA